MPAEAHRVALGRRDALDQRVQQLGHALPVFAESRITESGSSPSSSPISPATRSGSAPGRSILFIAGISWSPESRQVHVRDGLRLDPLGGVDEQQRPAHAASVRDTS